MVKSEWAGVQLLTALAEISIKELDSFSPLEDVSILPGRVHKGRCWALDTWSLDLLQSKQVTSCACCRAQNTTGHL